MSAKPTTPTIPLLETQNWLKEWQSTQTKCAKAFLIPAADLIATLTEIGVIVTDKNGVVTINSTVNKDIRAYLGIDPDPNKRTMKEGYGNKLFLVGTELVNNVHKDIVEDNTGVDLSHMNGTGIYDFITPCPSNCDIGSPLNNPK